MAKLLSTVEPIRDEPVVYVTELSYTAFDDGIHVSCSCGWDINLGYSPSPFDAATVAGVHLSTHERVDTWPSS